MEIWDEGMRVSRCKLSPGWKVVVDVVIVAQIRPGFVINPRLCRLGRDLA